MNRMLSTAVALSLALLAGCGRTLDPTEQRVEELLSKMTLREKIGQMNQVSERPDLLEATAAGEIGSVFNIFDAKRLNAIQKEAVENSRLGIPVLVASDVIHGYRTMMPIPLGQAATFDPALVEQGARVAAIEATAAGIRWTFSPMVDIARDPRWGRVAEGAGEDPYLDSQMGSAMVRGYQGTSPDSSTSMAACVKHFAGYGAAEGGRDYNTVILTERSLRNTYLPAFKACVDAGAMSLMTSFNEIDGIPSTGNRFLLHDVLRGEWGFDGVVVSDWNSIGEMVPHGFATDLKNAAELAVNAGVDMDMISQGYIKHIEELVAEGKINEKTIDDAVRNILRLKLRLGLFENPYVNVSASAKVDYAPEHLAVAKQIATESAVLLKNDNGTLPLKNVRTILVTGPLADAPYEQLGTWSFGGQPEHTVTPLAALRKEFNVIYEPALEYSRDKETSDFGRVVSAAQRADAVVVFVGEEAILSGEAHSLSSLNLQGAQSELIAAAKRSGKPVVVVVMAGRPLTIERDLANCDAMLYSFHPGTMGGEAICDLLKGTAVPSGKLPMTFLREAGQAPYYYNHNNTGRPNNGTEVLIDDIEVGAGQTSLGCNSYYLDSGYGPLFPFGYGLSYTTFSYSNITTDKTEYTEEETIAVEFDLTNTGSCEGTEIAQLYTRDLVGSVVRPVRELKRFMRITLAAGETQHITMELPVAELAFWNREMEYTVEPGDFDLWVAGDSASGSPLRLSVK